MSKTKYPSSSATSDQRAAPLMCWGKSSSSLFSIIKELNPATLRDCVNLLCFPFASAVAFKVDLT